MNCAALIFSIWKDFWNGFKHSEAFVSYDKTYTFKTALFEPYKEFLPALTIFFHAFGGTNDFTATILINANSNQDRDILNFAAPATL